MTVSLAQLAREFLDRPGLSQNTQQSYEFTLMPLLAEYGHFPVEVIGRQVLLDYLKAKEYLSLNTHRKHQAIINALFNYAVFAGYLAVNPIALLKRRKPNPNKGEHNTDQVVRYLSQSQLAILYDLVTEDARMHALVRLLHRTGARISELLALDLALVDTTARKFPVVGKGNKCRWCFYSHDAAIALNKYIKFYRDVAVPALFTARNPITNQVTRLSYSRVHTIWSNLIVQSPLLQGIRLHDLRHTFATERVGLMAIEELRALMGHEHIQTTLIYQKITSSRAEEVAQKALFILNKAD